MIFEVISGLKVNFQKFKFMGIGDVHNLEVLADSFGCPVGSLSAMYLGLLLGAKSRSR